MGLSVSRLILLILFIFSGLSAEEFVPKTPLKVDWSFDGIFGKFDRESTQRGYKVYKDVCAACHSMKRIAFRNLQEIGFSTEEVKEIAKSYQVQDGPNDEGDMFERPGSPSDYFVSPFPNKKAGMASNNGAYPPDLSLIVKARHDGANYVYSLLTGYTGEVDGHLYENPYFVTGEISMPPPLTSGLVEYDDGKESTVQNMAYDLVNFLQWASEPEMEQRKRIGWKVISFIIIATILLIITKHRIWKHLYK